MNATLTGIKCPVCGESVRVEADVHPGLPGTWDNPPEPPEINEVGAPEYECDCREMIETNAPRVKRYVVLKESRPEVMLLANGQPTVRWTPTEYDRDETGAIKQETRIPMLEAYDACVEEQMEAAEFEWDEHDPF